MTPRFRLELLFTALLLGVLGTWAPAQAGRQLVVVVHRDSPVASLSVEALKGYYLKQKKEWSSGEKVRPVQQEGPSHDVFLSKVLNMSGTDYERYWLERKYSAAETPPKVVEDDAAVARFVGAMKGAIGYVDSAALDQAARDKVKVIYAVNF